MQTFPQENHPQARRFRFLQQKDKSLEGAYGLRHIWDKHRVEIGATSAEDIVIFLESILLAGAEVLIDPKKAKTKRLL